MQSKNIGLVCDTCQKSGTVVFECGNCKTPTCDVCSKDNLCPYCLDVVDDEIRFLTRNQIVSKQQIELRKKGC